MSLCPDVSVVVPCYDAASTVADTLESVRVQTYSNWEAVCIDDGSTDATPQILDHFAHLDRRFRWQREEHRGLAASRNRALPLVRSQRVFFLDADDLLRRDALTRLVKASQEAGDNTIIAGGFELLDRNANPLGEYRFPGAGRFGIDEILSGGGPSASSLVPTGLLRKHPFDETVLTVEDTDLWLRMAQAGVASRVLPNVIFGYRLRERSLAHHADARFEWGCRILRRWMPHAQRPKQHRWHLHRLAWLCGAIAQSSGNAAALNRYLDALPAIAFSPQLAGEAANAVHWGYQFARGARGHTWSLCGEAWLSEISDWLESQPCAPQAKSICEHLGQLARRTADQVTRVRHWLAQTPRAGRLLIYGVGHNGLVLLERLRQADWARSVELAIADDGASNATFDALGLARDNPRRWTDWPANTLVVVTPNVCASMCSTLRQAGGQPGVHFVTLADSDPVPVQAHATGASSA